MAKVGPAARSFLPWIPHLMVGFLFQNPMSFAYTNWSSNPQSQMEFQPLISYTLGRGWYVKSAESTWTVNGATAPRLHFRSALDSGGCGSSRSGTRHWMSYEWTAYRQYTSITPMYTVRFGLTLLFPRVLL